MTESFVRALVSVCTAYPTSSVVMAFEVRINFTIEHLREVCPAKEALIDMLHKHACDRMEWYVMCGAVVDWRCCDGVYTLT